ncbi:MAG: cellulose binding domain-containing protein [Francisellaceae bacterium]
MKIRFFEFRLFFPHKKYLLAVGVVLSLISQSFAASDCDIEIDLRSEWSGGFVADVIIENSTNQYIQNWQLIWQGADFKVDGIWRAIVSGSNDDVLYIDAESYNQTIPANGMENFGFKGDGNYRDPSYVSLNGSGCRINGKGDESSDTTAPSVPVIYSLTTSENSIEIAWEPVDDNQTPSIDIHYQIVVDNQNIALIDRTTYTLSGLSPDTDYQIYVEALDQAGNASRSNTLNIKTLPEADDGQQCAYDVSQDNFTVVNEYQTTAISGWYSDTFATPVTTVNDDIYFVYVTPELKIKVGKIIDGVADEYELDSSFTVDNDAHNEFSIALDNKGYVHVTGGMHNKSFYYWRAEQPYDISSFKRHFGEIPGDIFSYTQVGKLKS